MTSTPDEFRAKTRKTVTLPSGLVVEIRKIRQRDLIEAGDLLIPVSDSEKVSGTLSESEKIPDALSLAEKLEAQDKADRYGRRAVMAGAVSPVMSDRETDKNNPDVVFILDLEQSDFYILLAEILSWSGLSEEAGQVAESFRADSEQGSSGRPGATIQ